MYLPKNYVYILCLSKEISLGPPLVSSKVRARRGEELDLPDLFRGWCLINQASFPLDPHKLTNQMLDGSRRPRSRAPLPRTGASVYARLKKKRRGRRKMAAYREKRAGSVEVEGEEVGVVVSVALQEPRCRSCRYAVASASSHLASHRRRSAGVDKMRR